MIIGLCMYVIPDDEVRKIKHLRVFIVTATWSVFAYVWLYLILAQISKGKVESWEGMYICIMVLFSKPVILDFVLSRDSERLEFDRVLSHSKLEFQQCSTLWL